MPTYRRNESPEETHSCFDLFSPGNTYRQKTTDEEILQEQLFVRVGVRDPAPERHLVCGRASMIDDHVPVSGRTKIFTSPLRLDRQRTDYYDKNHSDPAGNEDDGADDRSRLQPHKQNVEDVDRKHK